VEQHRHKSVKSEEFCLKLLKNLLVSKVALFYNSKHKLGVLVPKSFAGDRYHKLEKRSNCLTPVSFEKVVHRPQHLCELAIFTVSAVVAFEFFKEVLTNFA